MPIYEYECSACGQRHEILQKINEEPLKKCPVCHAVALKKLLSAAGFRLSGSGWYETDFKKSNRRNLREPSDGGKPKDKAEKPPSNKPDAPSASGAAAGKKSPGRPAKKETAAP